MGAIMAQRVEVVLDGAQRETLERWARRPKSAQGLALRCRIVLAAAEGRSSKEIAAALGCNANTVAKWRGRVVRGGRGGARGDGAGVGLNAHRVCKVGGPFRPPRTGGPKSRAAAGQAALDQRRGR